MGWVQEIIDWSKYLCLILETYDTIRNVYNAISVGIDVLRVYPPSYVAAVVVCGTSHTAGNVGEYGLTETLKQYCGFISCKEDYSSWAGIWRKNFNRYWGFTALGLEPNPYDNIVMAVGNLCLPAILYNVAKQRQIECRYVYCLEKEVPAGIPIKACNELKSYQYCKYWKGEIFSMIPFVGALNQLSGIIKSIITDPIGALNLIGALACGEICPVSGTLSAGCNVYIWYKAVIDLWEDIDQIQKGPEKISNDFCHQVDLGVF